VTCRTKGPMNAQIEQLGQVLSITLCVFILIVIAMLVYLFGLCLQLHRDARYHLRGPEVPRNSDGRRLKERI
jgi:hypothetical protein